jgi:ligand-binding sensor domain-containing protein
MKPAIKSFILTMLLVPFFLKVASQSIGLKYYKLEKDNRPVKINALYKNNQGYIYAGTDHGVYKFDGEKYSKIHFDNPDYNDTASALFQDRQQKFWVGFKSGRIANIINKKLVYFNPEEGTPKKKITAFLQDKEGNLWFSTNGEGIYFIRNRHLYLINLEDGLSDANISTLALAENGDVLAGSDQGINICQIKDGRKSISVIGPKLGLPDYIVTSIISAGKNSYWVGLHDKGFCLYDHATKKITRPPAAVNWKYGQINSLLIAQDMLWISTQDNGLYKYSFRNDILDSVPHVKAGNNIENLLQDNQGNIWLSSSGHGLIRTQGEQIRLIPIPGSPDFEHIHAILSVTNGDIWVNDYNNDLIRIYRQNGSYAAQKVKIPVLNEKTDITSLYQDANENIWVGSMGKGLFILDPHNLQQRSFTENPVFKNASILSISGKGNTVYVSSLEGTMAINIEPGNINISKPFRYINYDNSSTGTNYIYAVYKDSRNRVWFATDGNGLTMLKDKAFTYFTNKDLIKDDHIYSITEDRQGNIWFSTASAGIYKFDGKKFTNYSVNDGLSDLNISVLRTDNEGNIVIVHKLGLDILNPVTGTISYLNSNNGIAKINAEDLGAITQDTSGRVMVSTVDGILSYSSPANSLQKPTAVIESVQLFLKDIDDDRSPIFSHNENNFTFNYTGLYYSDPEQVYYQYRLEGLDSSWVVTRDRSKNFPSLEPGSYTFRIRSSLNRNFKNADEASYQFVIKQAFYKQAWFIIGCILIAAALLYWYIKSREASLKKMERLRQEKVQFQFEVLRNQVNPHFLFNSFNTLISTIEEDPKLAVEYVEHLSDFFRSIVNYRDKEIISLKEEAELLGIYYFLQQKRHGSNIELQNNLTEQQRWQYFIPPLTLQLLMENAIKHNAISTETKLVISLEITEDEYLQVKNNINTRMSRSQGAGMGLQNIVNRYTLLTNKKVLITHDEKYFIVSLPLLKN